MIPFKILAVSSVIYILVISQNCDGHVHSNHTFRDWKDLDNCERGLFPSVFNLATNAIINTNATCGETEPEIYCKLVEHVFMREPQCGVCDARSENLEYRHPITNAIDGTNQWWQSPTLQNGKHFEWVTVTLDLRQIFQVAYVIVKTATSPRPGNWLLEHSRDGLFYKTWQYYAISDAECWEAYGIAPTIGKPRYRSDDEIICTSYYSKLNPLENAEIHTSLVNGRPGAEGPSDTLREFTTARYVRLRLQKIRTLNADLMTMQSSDPQKIDKSTTRRYFYSIKDISIGGQCVCFGHSKNCLLNLETNLLQCQCEHNTCGENCEQCCPLYQQQLWRPGSNHDGAPCEKCQCFGHAEICFYDQTVADKKASLNIYGEYEGGGVCLKCMSHTTGINCEQCEDGYYRPLGVKREDPDPCRRCHCAGPGVTGFCFKDDSHVVEGQLPGDCICKEGFAGSKCDHCAPGYKLYPICEPCPCNPSGTEGGTTCEGRCICKANVEGSRCDKCKPGFYHFDGDNPDGCSSCYCTGITNQCQPSDWGVKIIDSKYGWRVTELYGAHIVEPINDEGVLRVSNEDMLGFDVYYWLAPAEFLGKKLYSYGGQVRYTLGYSVIGDDDLGTQASTPGIILEGDSTRIGYFFGSRQTSGNITIVLPLQERLWSFITAAGKRSKPVPKEDFFRVINNITRFMIRAKYLSDQVEGALYKVELEIANFDSKSLKRMTSVEKCVCPLGYAGLSCEVCESGYRRVDNILHLGNCESCKCNNHALSCDPYTGYCEDCQDNTTGLFCQQCSSGYHGDPRIGTVDDCEKCACPLPIPQNNFSPTCKDVILPDTSKDYVCTLCDDGYSGTKCEKCGIGYFGNPGVPDGYCQLCDCTGNQNVTDPNYCHHITGQCMNCIGNTGGWNCNECLVGHYGNALLHDCRPCGCSPIGSESSICDPATGLCECRLNFIGRNCDRCIDGYGNVELRCVPCQCNTTGSTGKKCDPVSGQCPCKAGVFGLKCDTCLDGYYSYSENGCRWCGCDMNGAARIQCNSTGFCLCKPNVIGQLCDQCEPGYWNLLSGDGCEDCKCDPIGSTSSDDCDDLYGQCSCRVGIGGDKCDVCLPGYYGLSLAGCKKCEPCQSTGHICDNMTGLCLCPQNTEGDYCQRCTHSSWGYDPLHGCKPCNCNFQGSPSDVCDVDNGNCLCLEGYEGRCCDKCRFAHFQFPKCRKCDCRHDGSEPFQCTAEGQCQCDDNGQCPCKANVEGFKCEACKNGTFGMTLDNPKGCFTCFCFGRSNSCIQAQMVWSQVTMPAREVYFELGDTPLAKLHGFLLLPGHTGKVKLGIPYILDKPVYWMLSRSFLGQKVKSYNGILQFHIESRSARDFPDPLLLKYPLVVIHGNHRIVLVHSPFLPEKRGRYRVRFHEDEWRQLENPQVPVSRALMMIALENVQNILIRATEGADVKIMSGNFLRLSDVSLEMAVPISPNPASPYVAVGVELCQCPKDYSGSSCQDPGKGFYRKFKPNFLESPEIIDVVGYSAPCPCNNRSESCDPETGHCHNCRENTAGAFCEFCSKGFFGDPAMSRCKPCACPLVTNSFSDTCESMPMNDHACTNCQQGYEGKNCERCSRGYYGNPSIPNGSCKPCDCSPYGSLDRICDRMTGQCHCRKGISGRDCSQCATRHILTELGCKSCDNECIGPLLDDVEFLTDMAKKNNITNFLPPPWLPLLTIDNQTIGLQKAIGKYRNFIGMGSNITQNFSIQFDFETLADFMYLRSRDIHIKSVPTSFDALGAKEDAESLTKDLTKAWKHIFDSVNKLQNDGLNLTLTSKAIDINIGIAERIVKDIARRDLSEQRQEAERELRKVTLVSQAVRRAIINHELFGEKKKQLDQIGFLLSESIRLIERNVRRLSVKSSNIIEEGRHKEQYIYDSVINATKESNFTEVTLANAFNLLVLGKKYMENATESLQHLLSLQLLLDNATEQMEHHRGILARLNPRYIQKFVIPAKEHADYISKQALYLSDLFSATRIVSQFPLQAATVYDEIMDTLDFAEQRANEAYSAADRAHYELQLESQGSLTKQAIGLKRKSESLKDEAIDLMLDVQAMQGILKKKQVVIEKLKLDNSGVVESMKSVSDLLDKLPRNIGDRLHDIEDEHKRTKNKMEAVHEDVDQIIDGLNGDLYPRLDQLRVGSSAGLYQITKTIEDFKSTTTAAIKKADSTERRVNKVNRMNSDMRAHLKELKSKIILARQKASNIRVSLSADKAGVCVRSYIPDIEPSTTTNIVLNYAISTDIRDSLLFFLASSQTEDFMIIEMVDRKIRFLWNAGAGTQVLQHNLTIKTNDEQLLKNEHWYKVEVNRFGNVATLSVKPTPDGQKPDPYEVTDASPPGFSKMDLDSTSFFYIGGTPKGFRVPRELKARNFAGCLYEVVLDGKKVGLWNFVTSQGCVGCKEGATEDLDLGSYSFKGDGYTVLPQIKRYKKTSYLVALRFKTFDEDALLFFSPNPENGDFVSLELRDGHVVYQFNMGSPSRSMLRSTKKYNTGNWTHVAAFREKLQGQLSVGDEFLEGQFPTGGPIKMELQKSSMYFGGVPPNFTHTIWNGITFQKFLGCMKDLQIDSTLLDLLKNGYHSVEPSCRDSPIKIVSFQGKGYIEVGSHPLLLESNFGFAFRTLKNNAVLMLSTFDSGHNGDKMDKKDYYSVAIVDGNLEARFGGKRETRIITSTPINDGLYHMLTVIKRHRNLVLRVDDIEVGSARLPKGSKNIEAPFKRGLFFGGLKNGIFWNVMLSTNEPLVGTIKDVIFNNRIIHFNEPVDFKGVGIGHSEKHWLSVDEPYTGVTQPLERCAEMASYILEKRAVNFGDEVHSHAKITIGRKDFVHDFNVTFSLRTYYPNGLIALVKNGRSVSHFAIFLLDGHVTLDIYDRKQKRINLPITLHDGNWHTITVTKTGRNISMKIDKIKKSLTVKVRRRLALRSPLYVGGFPEDITSIPDAVESFKGCIKEFHLNDNYLDLASGELHSVSQCFSTIEPGAYFAGDAYAVYAQKFNLGMKLDVQMEFKTTRLNGVLLSLSSKNGVPSLALELFNGSVVVSVYLENGEKPFQALQTFQSKYEMCDGRWHIVSAQYAHKTVTLKVDMYEIVYGLSDSIPKEPKTSVPLFIGGVPDDAVSHALHIQDNFMGCLKNIAINDRRVDWIDMVSRNNVFPNSCPTF